MMKYKNYKKSDEVEQLLPKDRAYLHTRFTADAASRMNHNNRNNTPSPVLQLTVPFPLFQTDCKQIMILAVEDIVTFLVVCVTTLMINVTNTFPCSLDFYSVYVNKN
jgi:hypothetical protein